MSALVLRGLIGLGLLMSAAGCREGRLADSDRSTAPGQTTTVEGAAEPAAPAEGKAAYDLASPPSSQVRLPAELREISGLAVGPKGRVFAHGDEDATVYQLDPHSGRVTKHFALAASGSDPDLGKKSRYGRLAGDFEDIAIVGDRFFLVSSNGVLLEFAEGQDRGLVPYRAYPTGLEQVCEVEGLAHDPSTKSLLLLCKTMQEKSDRQQVTVYSWSLAERTLGDTPRLVVPWSALARVTGGKGFNGSAVALAPGGQSLLMVAGPQQLFAEVGSDGAPIRGGSIDRGTHPQPESLAFLPDGTLLVASEGGKGEAVLARYSPRERSEGS
jgi:uncharacterized protein YjiK